LESTQSQPDRAVADHGDASPEVARVEQAVGEIAPDVPLCVDLDGTLVKSDTLLDTVIVLARQRPRADGAGPESRRPHNGHDAGPQVRGLRIDCGEQQRVMSGRVA